MASRVYVPRPDSPIAAYASRLRLRALIWAAGELACLCAFFAAVYVWGGVGTGAF